MLPEFFKISESCPEVNWFLDVLSAVEGMETRLGPLLGSNWPLDDFSCGLWANPPFNNRGEGSRKKTVSCTHCDKKFWNKSDCIGHINSQHLKLKPYVCRKCAQQFSYKQSWKSHELFCQIGKN